MKKNSAGRRISRGMAMRDWKIGARRVLVS
jgi:hypothetical protein